MAAPIPPKALRDIWDQVPKMANCKGLCHTSCGPVPATPLERRLIEERAGKSLGSQGHLTCSMLLPNGRCGVYSVRPLICRIWGATEGVVCNHGCEPEQWLTHEDADRLMRETLALSPGADYVRMQLDVLDQLAPLERLAWEEKNPDWRRQLAEIYESDRA